MPVQRPHPRQNHLLAALRSSELARVAPMLELVELRQGAVLVRSGERITHAIFPTSAVISIQYEREDGGASEIANVGNEGLFGVPLFMGGVTTPSRSIVHRAGWAYRMRAASLLEGFNRKEQFFDLLLRYAQLMMTQISQTGVCNAHHTTLQRLSRCLLTTLDRSGPAELVVTQEALGAVLGIRREGITEAAGRLQAMGWIRSRRGHIEVLAREGLEQQACECYLAMRDETAHLMTQYQAALQTTPRAQLERAGMSTRRTGDVERRGPQLPRAPHRDQALAGLDQLGRPIFIMATMPAASVGRPKK